MNFNATGLSSMKIIWCRHLWDH